MDSELLGYERLSGGHRFSAGFWLYGLDATIMFGLIGVPMQVAGVYNLVTGIGRVWRGAKQQIRASHEPQTVHKTPLQWCWDVFLNLAPGGSGIEDILGGLP